MDRMTRSRLETAFAAYIRTLRGLGVECEGYRLVHGSVSNGQSWKVLTGEAVRAPGTDIYGHIGGTPREAYNTLHIIIRALQDSKETVR